MTTIFNKNRQIFIIKSDKYFFFIKAGAANVLLKLNYLGDTVHKEDTVQKVHISHTKQYQTFYRRLSVTY